MPNTLWLDAEELTEYLNACPDELHDLVLELRDLVRAAAPRTCEAIRFHALCYFKPDQPYGAIGGNVCMITPRAEHVRLEFIHGAFLPDPAGLLRGSAKAKRFIEIRSRADLRRRAVRTLIRAALAYTHAEHR